MYFYCETCKKKYPLNSHSYRCTCGGMFRLHKDQSDELTREISLGEFQTPLLPIRTGKLDFLLKLENLLPTGSFKDRGACTLINELHHLGIKKIALDSAGNAGASIAAYAGAAGMDCTVYVPDDISDAKVAQIEDYGAKIVKVPNGRMNACAVVKENLGDAYYASHVYNPLFFEGMKSMAREMVEQLGGAVPDYVFMPVGNGTMLIGLFQGFMDIGRLPHFVAVQSKKCAPLYEAYHGLPPEPKRTTIASAIRIEKPKRLKDMVEIIRASSGDVVAVEDADILQARKFLGAHGIYVEMTSAAALAGAEKYFQAGKPDNYKVVLPMTGNGLKR
ncbi:pyridoxal-phosphate dependent enzyme [Selenomonas sp. WCA-380-WT-3B 3/]|uniref:Pyridoxal-phosphate dependent enzyme n=1 Tax=Selenomonas montiformis TaxID=2652285 RepID=A0A6I2V0R4_9FIRM|nr:pyridoxal-phosphate dependent enzyme [Selenomonas montiformis]MSV25940.1 pyridoxal-phosphate dependent enzyme [Selenomonas montiformis]